MGQIAIEIWWQIDVAINLLVLYIWKSRKQIVTVAKTAIKIQNGNLT